MVLRSVHVCMTRPSVLWPVRVGIGQSTPRGGAAIHDVSLKMMSAAEPGRLGAPRPHALDLLAPLASWDTD